jgi:hypothetical protein
VATRHRAVALLLYTLLGERDEHMWINTHLDPRQPARESRVSGSLAVEVQ